MSSPLGICEGTGQLGHMGDGVGFPTYAVNMLYYHWSIKKLLWSMAGQNTARWEIQAEIEEERR